MVRVFCSLQLSAVVSSLFLRSSLNEVLFHYLFFNLSPLFDTATLTHCPPSQVPCGTSTSTHSRHICESLAGDILGNRFTPQPAAVKIGYSVRVIAAWLPITHPTLFLSHESRAYRTFNGHRPNNPHTTLASEKSELDSGS